MRRLRSPVPKVALKKDLRYKYKIQDTKNLYIFQKQIYIYSLKTNKNKIKNRLGFGRSKVRSNAVDELYRLAWAPDPNSLIVGRSEHTYETHLAGNTNQIPIQTDRWKLVTIYKYSECAIIYNWTLLVI